MEDRRLVLDYEPRKQFAAFHNRTKRFACIVSHRRAGKTVACVHDLQLAATAAIGHPDRHKQMFGAE